MPIALLAAALLAAGLVAQDPSLPTLFRLGPAPSQAVTVHLPVSSPFQPPAAPDVVLRVPAATPWLQVDAVLASLVAAGTERVHFAARLPDGTAGCLGLALPTVDALAADVPSTLTLRAHRRRPGVPLESLTLLLTRLLEPAPQLPKATLSLEVPGDTRCEQVLRVLGACIEGGVASLPVRVGAAAGIVDDRSALAFDLDGLVSLQVAPQQRIGSGPELLVDALSRPQLLAEAFGALQAPLALAIEPELGGGAGGAFGGRGAWPRGQDEQLVAAVERSLDWLARQVGDDGACRAEGVATVEATSLAMLAWLGSGSQLVSGRRAPPLRRTAGWLLASQHADGTFGPLAEAGPRSQALACLALAEAGGLSSPMPYRLLRRSLQDGLQRLWRMRFADGGFGGAGASDGRTTSVVVLALASAKCFRVPAPAEPAALDAWLAAHPGTSAGERAALTFAACFADQGKPTEATVQDLVAARAFESAEDCYWISHALNQAGGKALASWSEPFLEFALGKQVAEGPAAGAFVVVAPEPSLSATAWWTLALQARVRYQRLLR